MLRDFIAKNFFFLLMMAALFGFIGVFLYAMELEDRNVPPANMQSEFGKSSGRAVVGKGAALQGNLAIQHLSSREVAMVLDEIVAESLTFTKDDYTAVVARMQKNFTPAGYAQYKQFLEGSGVQATLAAQDLQSGAYLEQDPLELAKGVYDGVYKWVFEVPVTISFMPRDADTYRDDQTPVQNRRFVLRAQFARVRDDKDPDIIKIENWQVFPAREN